MINNNNLVCFEVKYPKINGHRFHILCYICLFAFSLLTSRREVRYLYILSDYTWVK